VANLFETIVQPDGQPRPEAVATPRRLPVNLCDQAAPASTGLTKRHCCQYTSEAFARFTDTLGICRSLGRTGTCYDNAWAESFNGTIKVERIHRTVYPTRERARIDISRYIELWYNQNRLHSALGYRTPNKAEYDWHQQQAA
jgi:transposase InsO family protein